MFNICRYGNRRSLFLVFVGSLSLAIMNGIHLRYLKVMTDYAVVGEVQSLVSLIPFLIVLGLFQFLFRRLNSYAKAHYIRKSISSLKRTYAHHLLKMDLMSLSEKDERIFLSQLSHDMDRYEERYFVNLLSIMDLTLNLFVSIIILLMINVYLFFVAVILFTFIVVLSGKTSEPIKKHEEMKSQSLSLYTYGVEESIRAWFEIKQYALYEMMRSKFYVLASDVQNEQYRLDLKSSHMDAINMFFQFFFLFVLILMGVSMARLLDLSIGSTLLAGTAFSSSIWPLQSVAPLMNKMKGIEVILKDFESSLKYEEHVDFHSTNSLFPCVFNQVSLGYGDHMILKNINMEIDRGEKILIIGRSGTGKTTILKALRRQLKPVNGIITCNHKDIHQIDPMDYFSKVTVVDQKGFVFNATVAENIEFYSKGFLSSENLIKQVGLDLALADYLHDNGRHLSGGQRSRVLLARSLYIQSEMILCDEVLANLDERRAYNLEKLLLSLPQTLVNVSHMSFDEHRSMYDRVYELKDDTVRQINL